MSFDKNKNFEYIKESFLIKYKTLKEYKTNLYLEIFTAIIYLISFIIFLVFIYNELNVYIGWEKKDYLFFILFEGFALIFFGMFMLGCNLKTFLLSGDMNLYLVKPINIFLQYFILILQLFSGLTSILYFILLIIFLLIFSKDYSFFRLILTFLIFFLGGLFLVIATYIFDSLAFFMKESKFLYKPYKNFYQTFDKYPVVLFKNSIKYFALFCGNIYYTTITTHFLFGYMNYSEFFFYLFTLIILIILSAISVYYLWKYGLKKYEAFG